MSNNSDSSAIRDASKAVEGLHVIIAAMRFAAVVRASPVAKDGGPQAVEKAPKRAVTVFVRQLRKQLAIARQSYADDTASCIRVEAYRRPVSAHDMVMDVATVIAGRTHQNSSIKPLKTKLVCATLGELAV